MSLIMKNEYLTTQEKWLDTQLRRNAIDIKLSDAFAHPVGPISSDFLSRCRQAASEARIITMLRLEHEQGAYLPMAIGTYIEQLAEAAKLDTSTIQELLEHLQSVSTDDHSFAQLASLLQSLGMSLREALISMRISLAEEFGISFQTQTIRARASGNAAIMLDETEAELFRVESKYDVDQRRQLLIQESMLRLTFVGETASDGEGLNYE